MNLAIPKIVKPLALAEYAEEFEEACLYVWVNPPGTLINELNDSLKSVQTLIQGLEEPKKGEPKDPKVRFAGINEQVEEILTRQLTCYSELLSQGPEGSQMSVEELRTISTETSETDPAFWNWVKARVAALIREHRDGIKKG